MMTHPGSRSRPWRSWLFVPADNARLLEGSGTRGADVIVCDLEDAVADVNKEAARQLLLSTLPGLARAFSGVCVRVNGGAELSRDLAVVVHPAVDVIMLPKAESADQVADLASQIVALERGRGAVESRIGIVALIETPRGVLGLPEIAGAPGLVGLAFGSEDYSARMGVPPTDALLEAPVATIAVTAAAHRLMAIGAGTALRNFRDPDAFQAATVRARSVGMTGALCIHPSQVIAVNRAFEPTETDVTWALSVVAKWNSAGAAVTAQDGEMIDRPVIELARAILKDAPSHR